MSESVPVPEAPDNQPPADPPDPPVVTPPVPPVVSPPPAEQPPRVEPLEKNKLRELAREYLRTRDRKVLFEYLRTRTGRAA